MNSFLTQVEIAPTSVYVCVACDRTYMEQGARKKVHLSDTVYNRLRSERDRPRTPTLKEAQKYILPHIEEYFANFWNVRAPH